MEKSLAEKLYEYLKVKYGVQGTETFKKIKIGIPKKIEILIPGVAKNNNKHKWVAFLEKQDSEEINALIIGQEWKDEHCSWSRYIEVLNNNEHVGFGWFKVTDNTYLSSEYDFKSLMIFIKVLCEFSSTILI